MYKDKYYLINERYPVMTNVSSCYLLKAIKSQFDIDVYDIKCLTEQEYLNILISKKYLKPQVKYFKEDLKWVLS